MDIESITIKKEPPISADALRLIAELDELQQSLYPPEACHMTDPNDLMGQRDYFLVARHDQEPLGCAGLKYLADENALEVKRMFVRPAARGSGLAKEMLERLESEAIRQKVCCLLLETGHEQPAAVRLYQKSGFRERGPYASYPEHPMSLFMQKDLPKGDSAKPVIE